MSTYGRQVLNKTGRDVMVLADLQDAQFKVGGITLAWALFAAASSDSTLTDQTPIKAGEKYCRFGQIVCKVTQPEVQTVDLSGDADPTGGTWALTVFGEAVSGLAYNASAATVQAAIRALDNPAASGVSVSKSGFVYTITFPDTAENVPAVTVNHFLTSGGSITVAVGTTTQGTSNAGKYGPYDPAATDGRQNLTRGNCWIINRTVKENGAIADLQSGTASDHPQAFDGGTAWKPRILMTSGAHSLADGPTVAEFEAAFPRIAYAQ